MSRLGRIICANLLALCAPVAAEENCFAFLNAHQQRRELPKEEAEQIQREHIAHIGKMAKDGHLIAAGPMMDGGNWRGILIFQCQSPEQVKALAEQDPAVLNKRLVVEAYRWSNTGGIGVEYKKALAANPSHRGKMLRYPVALIKKNRNGPALSEEKAAETRAQHEESVKRLRVEGKLAVAGPFQQGGDLLGVFIYQQMPKDEARRLTEGDPLVSTGAATFEMYEWLCEEKVMPAAN